MEKIRHAEREELATMPFSYVSCAPFIDFAGYWFERNGERITVVQDVKFPHDFPSVFLPSQQSNWERCSVMLCTQEQKERVQALGIPLLVDHPIATEFFYRTDAFLEPTGSLKKKVSRFEKTYTYRVTHTCDPEKVSTFYNTWKTQKSREEVTFEESEQFYEFCWHIWIITRFGRAM